ncbi:dihydroorotase [Cardiosporidium cionae]|uniref:Dihydroorotase n=1 Tax=Cardiosporidium cionae TaxID=476202 RepID=A0ABQ7J7N9_9APIC|nr:dihydroorotase [Cardiosporidium cionae]|eukprot:KAF8819991.1 dihydroorotase [Cardiosporidium cionae]
MHNQTMHEVESFAFPLINDMHTHLRQEDLMEAVTPMVMGGGCGRVLVMPNTIPPITSCDAAKEYCKRLEHLEPRVEYMMTLYLSPEISIDDLRNNAASCHVTGVKSYPRGVTTNSEFGVESYERYYELFGVMEELGLVLHLHGEIPSVSPLQAEQLFVPQAVQLCKAFPKLKIVLEHVSSKAAVLTVKSHQRMAATVTVHHLELTAEDVLNDPSTSETDVTDLIKYPHNFCKPLAKLAGDREAIRQVVQEGHPRFFLGSDSAPHKKSMKESKKPPAGIFTQPLLLAVSLLDRTDSFLLWSLKSGELCAIVERKSSWVPLEYPILATGEKVVPYKSGFELAFTVRIEPFEEGN